MMPKLSLEKFKEHINVLEEIRTTEEKLNDIFKVEGYIEMFDSIFDSIVSLLEIIFNDEKEIISNWIYFEHSEDFCSSTDEIYDILTGGTEK